MKALHSVVVMTNLLDRFEPTASLKMKQEVKGYETKYDDIKAYSGTNPLLLSKWSGALEKYVYVSKVRRVVNQFVEQNLKIHTDNPVSAVLATESLDSYRKFIVYAANETKLDKGLKSGVYWNMAF